MYLKKDRPPLAAVGAPRGSPALDTAPPVQQYCLSAQQPQPHKPTCLQLHPILYGRKTAQTAGCPECNDLQPTHPAAGNWRRWVGSPCLPAPELLLPGPPPGVFAQAGVEMGLPGLAVLLAVWFLFFKKMRRMLAHRRARRLLRSFNSHEQKAAHRERTGRSDRRVGRDAPSSHNIDEDAQLKGAAWAIFTAAIVIGMYSLVECTISMAALSLFLFTLIGLGKALGRLFISERPDCQGCADSAESPEYFKGLENPEHPERTKSSKCSEDTRSPKNSKNLRRWFRPQSPSVRKKLLQCFAVSGAALLVIAISLNNFAGESYYLKAAQAIKQGDIQTAGNEL